MSDWNWTPRARRLGSNLIALTCLVASVSVIVWLFILATN